MKIVSYNIAKCSQTKIDYVLGMNADFYILPECADSKSVILPKGYAMFWTGDDDMPQKDLELSVKNLCLLILSMGIERLNITFL